MNGIILAGGTGRRLSPCSNLINKHLLPVYDKPMIFYPIQFLQRSGISKIIIVVNKGAQAQLVSKAVSYERQFDGLDIIYVTQESPMGTAHAISLCRNFLDTSFFTVLWGDNIFEFCGLAGQKVTNHVAKIFVKEVDEVAPYSCVKLDEKGHITKIISNYEKSLSGPGHALTGLFVLNDKLFQFISRIKPNQKNELDLVDVLNEYMSTENLYAEIVHGFWIDAASSFDNLLNSAYLVQKYKANKFLETN